MVELLLSIDELPASGALHIYGCGSAGRSFAQLMEHYLPKRDFSFIDTTHSGSLMGRSVTRLYEIPADGLEAATIVVASTYRAEIIRQLSTWRIGSLYDGLPLVEAAMQRRTIIRIGPVRPAD